MLKIQKYAAIDIGSNAVRLLISNIIEQEDEPTIFKKNSLVRVPIRLGADVFLKGEISEYNQERMIDTMKAFRLIMKSHGVNSIKLVQLLQCEKLKIGSIIRKNIRN